MPPSSSVDRFEMQPRPGRVLPIHAAAAAGAAGDAGQARVVEQQDGAIRLPRQPAEHADKGAGVHAVVLVAAERRGDAVDHDQRGRICSAAAPATRKRRRRHRCRSAWRAEQATVGIGKVKMQALDIGRLEAALARHAIAAAGAFRASGSSPLKKITGPGFAGGAEPIAQSLLDRDRELQRDGGFAAPAIARKDSDVAGGDPVGRQPSHRLERQVAPCRRTNQRKRRGLGGRMVVGQSVGARRDRVRQSRAIIRWLGDRGVGKAALAKCIVDLLIVVG